ncbi:hypothetical protein T190115A13A_60199 [Tenacibaculum sp. 190524A02b]|uniref:Uncharacterized protein n=1 Tax=Tenacibaculum vairaonense TaxID=3137860 RepID=A0ABP1FH73_9FLAO
MKRIAMVVIYTAEIPENLDKSEIYEELEFMNEDIVVNVHQHFDIDEDFNGQITFEKRNELLGETYQVNVDDHFSIGKA